MPRIEFEELAGNILDKNLGYDIRATSDVVRVVYHASTRIYV